MTLSGRVAQPLGLNFRVAAPSAGGPPFETVLIFRAGGRAFELVLNFRMAHPSRSLRGVGFS